MPGDRAEMQNFQEKAINNTRLHIELSLPNVNALLPSKDFFELVYNRWVALKSCTTGLYQVLVTYLNRPQLNPTIAIMNYVYHQTSRVSWTKPQHLNVSHLILQLSLPNSLKPGLKSRMKM